MTSWRDEAACKGMVDIFFYEAKEEEAKAVCAKCPVKKECLHYAIRTKQESLVFGGFNFDERRKIVSRNKRRERRFRAAESEGRKLPNDWIYAKGKV